MKIDDPKTPYHEENVEEDQDKQIIYDQDPEDPIVHAHLLEAKINRDKNA
jgi:hypothetical protein